MVAKSAGVDVGRHEVVSEGEHGQQGCVAGFVAKVILEHAACEFRARGRFGCDELRLLAVEDVVAHEGEGDAAEV